MYMYIQMCIHSTHTHTYVYRCMYVKRQWQVGREEKALDVTGNTPLSLLVYDALHLCVCMCVYVYAWV